MKAIIFGAGAVGFQLAKVLIAEKYDVVIIENNLLYLFYDQGANK